MKPKFEIDRHADYGWIVWERATDLYLEPNFKTWGEAFRFVLELNKRGLK